MERKKWGMSLVLQVQIEGTETFFNTYRKFPQAIFSTGTPIGLLIPSNSTTNSHFLSERLLWVCLRGWVGSLYLVSYDTSLPLDVHFGLQLISGSYVAQPYSLFEWKLSEHWTVLDVTNALEHNGVSAFKSQTITGRLLSHHFLPAVPHNAL